MSLKLMFGWLYAWPENLRISSVLQVCLASWSCFWRGLFGSPLEMALYLSCTPMSYIYMPESFSGVYWVVKRKTSVLWSMIIPYQVKIPRHLLTLGFCSLLSCYNSEFNVLNRTVKFHVTGVCLKATII